MNGPLEREIELFNAALDLPFLQRAAYLSITCAGDVELQRRVEALVHVHEQAGTFLETPVAGTPLARPNVESDVRPQNGLGGQGPAARTFQPGQRVGNYRILEVIGEGGCGVVYLADQEMPIRRQVALKVIKLGMDTETVIARFSAEQQALALMDHPNIAKVFDAGATETGRPFFVMEYVNGVRITEYCNRHNLSTRGRLDLFIQVCGAVQHAHQKGIIHRDLKPSNVLVTMNEPGAGGMPKVIDFGIAKATQGRLTDQTLFTAVEQFLGTPAYMSPEQSNLTRMDIDTRSDIYSLGVLLYELLTGSTPFDTGELLKSGVDEMRRIIREREPMRPSTRLNQARAAQGSNSTHSALRIPHSEFDRDLDWIVMKCLEKDRSRRYDTVNGLAVDLQRFLVNQPIVARPPSKWYRLQKLVRRHRLVFGAAASVVAALIIGLGVSTWQFLGKSKAEAEQNRLREAAQKAQAAEAQLRVRAEKQELTARKKAYASDMNLLQQALAADDLVRAQELLDRQRPQPGELDLRGWEWRYYWQFCRSDVAAVLCQRSNSITSVSFSGDGAYLAVNTFAGEVTVWEMASRRLIFRHATSSTPSSRLAFAPSGSLLAFFDRSNQEQWVVLWDCRSESEAGRLRLQGDLRELAFSNDGRLFTADLSRSNNITVWDVTRGIALAHFSASLAGYDMGSVFGIARSGARYAQVLKDRTDCVRVAEISGATNYCFRVSEELTTALAFSPDERVLVTGGGYAGGAIRLWDIASHQLVGSLEGHRSWISCVKFLPDGQRLVSASADGTVRLWDFQSHQLLRTLRGHSGELWAIDVSPDGQWAATGCKDGSVSFWDLRSSTILPPLFRAQPATACRCWEFSPDGRMVGVIEQDHLKLYDIRTLRPLCEPGLGLTNIGSFGFSPDMRLLAAADLQGHLEVWDMTCNRRLTNFTAHSGRIALSNRSFLPDGRLLTYGADGFAKEWEPSSWEEIRRWSVDPNQLRNLAISPAAGLVASASQDGMFELMRFPDDPGKHRFKGESRTVALDLSSDGTILAGASENGTVELWDTSSATRIALLRGVMLGYHSVALSPDQERVAAGSNGQEAMKIWDVRSHEEVATLRGNGSLFSQAKFSPDGNTIAAQNWNGMIHFWSAPSWKEIEAAEKCGASEAGFETNLCTSHSSWNIKSAQVSY